MTTVQVTFSARGAVFTALPWLLYEVIKGHGVDIFTDSSEVSNGYRQT